MDEFTKEINALFKAYQKKDHLEKDRVHLNVASMIDQSCFQDHCSIEESTNDRFFEQSNSTFQRNKDLEDISMKILDRSLFN